MQRGATNRLNASAVTCGSPRSTAPYPPAVAVPVVVLALAGMVDLVFERVVYRIGIHVPKDASLMPAYEGATAIGDGAFRYVMVLAVFAALAAAGYLLSSRHTGWRVIGAAFVALVVADTMTIVWDDVRLGLAVNALFAGTLTVLLGIAGGGALTWPFRAAAGAAGLALLAGQYPVVATRMSEFTQDALPGVAASLSIAEAAIVAVPVALLIGAEAWRRPDGRRALLIGLMAALAMGAAWLRAPSTVAILSLWGTGITMSFPAPVYLVAAGAAVAAAITFAMDPGMRHVPVVIALLLVSGVQPTVTQYNLAALLGMAILVLGPAPTSEHAGPGRLAGAAVATGTAISPRAKGRAGRAVLAAEEGQ